MTTSTNNIDDLIRLEVEEGVAFLIFDRKDSGANIFDIPTLDALDQRLDWVESQTDIRGVVFETAKNSIFVAGADLNTLATAEAKELEGFLWKGQKLFNRIEDLKLPTVAAIHGAAMGGGLEVALACDMRIASDEKSTRLALPETQLGIMPAWGGSTRLPKLIGLPKALPIILKGSSLNAKQAKRKGLVKEITSKEKLRVLAKRLVFQKKTKPKKKPSLIGRDPLTSKVIKKKALEGVLKKTRGHYPAQEAAIEVACASLRVSRDQSLKNERDETVRLAQTTATENLVRMFFLTEKAKKLGDKSLAKDIKEIAVVGAGVMGAGIVHWLSARGYNVMMIDINPEAIAKGLNHCEKLRTKMVKRGLATKTEAMKMGDRITVTHEKISLYKFDLIIEAAVEDMEIKKSIFKDLSTRSAPEAILATNTSALSVTELSKAKGIKNPQRIIGLHFFNPVHMMKLVEVVEGEKTSPETLAKLTKFVQKIGKLPVVVQDSPGFIVNRVLIPYLVEAGHLYDLGVDPEKIDKAMLDFGMPMGPLRLLDEVGLDVGKHVASTMEAEFADRFTTPQILNRMVEAGLLGKKGGEGFYTYKGKKGEEISDKAKSLRKTPGEHPMTEQEITDRLTLLMINESFLCLEEKIVPDSDDVDFAMIMGAGFAPFRGGPITHAKNIGLDNCADKLEKLLQKEGERYRPSQLIQSSQKNKPTKPGAKAKKKATTKKKSTKKTSTKKSAKKITKKATKKNSK